MKFSAIHQRPSFQLNYLHDSGMNHGRKPSHIHFHLLIPLRSYFLLIPLRSHLPPLFFATHHIPGPFFLILDIPSHSHISDLQTHHTIVPSHHLRRSRIPVPHVDSVFSCHRFSQHRQMYDVQRAQRHKGKPISIIGATKNLNCVIIQRIINFFTGHRYLRRDILGDNQLLGSTAALPLPPLPRVYDSRVFERKLKREITEFMRDRVHI
mmetsp:Transcript_56112/g.76538  ORF Transcript_56112/g.76538 Transcript_56112/m.76538 type:complete len:209 (-) Transcript_56112:201-827(-)